MFSLIFLGGKLFLQIAGKIAKIVKIKNSCHTVSLVYLNFFCIVDSLSLYFRKTKKNRLVRRRKASAHLKFSLIVCNTIELQLERRTELNCLNFDMDRVFKRRKRVFFSLLSILFLYTANRPDENEIIQFFKLSLKGRLYTAQLVHKIKVFIPEVI